MDIKKINDILNSMTIDELCGQVLCYTAPLDVYKGDFGDFEEMIKRTKPGGLFVNSGSGEDIKRLEEAVNKYLKIPVIISGDTENGPNTIKDYPHRMPFPMAWGAADDEALVEEGGVQTARICRKNGVHWSYAPLVDINLNKDNPVVNTRAISSSPREVAKIASAYLRGLQKEGLMAGGCKHFPGDGTDDRNQHFCTSINSMSKDEWRNTFGYVYKEIIKQNPGSIMVGHIALPSFQEDEYDEATGYLPGTLSYNIITKLLKGELGYEGCVVSDALSMIGVSAVVDEDRLPIEFLKAGGDMELFAEEKYFDLIKSAVECGEIPIERLKDAVRRILKLKDSIGLLEKKEAEVKPEEGFVEVSGKIAEKSVKIVRDLNSVLPLDLKKGSKVLIVNIYAVDREGDMYPYFDHVKNAFTYRGIDTVVLTNPNHRAIEKVYSDEKIDAVLVLCRHSEHDSNGGSLRLGWDNVMTFWRGLIFRHNRVVFVSLGDPYKLYELPFLKTYVNTFSPTKESQEALVKVLLGEIEPKAKNPVGLKGFFESEV